MLAPVYQGLKQSFLWSWVTAESARQEQLVCVTSGREAAAGITLSSCCDGTITFITFVCPIRDLRKPSGSFLWTRTTMWSVITVRWGLSSARTYTYTQARRHRRIWLSWFRVIQLFRLLRHGSHCLATDTLLGHHSNTQTQWAEPRTAAVGPDQTLFSSDKCESSMLSAVEWKTQAEIYQPKVTATSWLIDKAHSSAELWTLLGACCSNQTCEIAVTLPINSFWRF